MKPFSIDKQLMTLNEDEQQLLDSIEKGEWISNYDNSSEFEIRKAKLTKAAQNTMNVQRDTEEIEITIHLPQNIFQKIISSSEKAGVHYQNWIINALKKAVV